MQNDFLFNKELNFTVQKLIKAKIGDKGKRLYDSNLKNELLEKQNWICPRCGNKISASVYAELDHILEYCNNGKTIPENAQVSHRYCNRAGLRLVK